MTVPALHIDLLLDRKVVGAPCQFSDLAGWCHRKLRAGLESFARSVPALLGECAEQRQSTWNPPAVLAAIAREIRSTPSLLNGSENEIASYFKSRFRPYPVRCSPRTIHLTGYFEPQFRGSACQTREYAVPLHGLPSGYLPLAKCEQHMPGYDEIAARGLTSARCDITGRLHPLPSRREIKAGALRESLEPLAWVENEVESFLIHVQGSVRLHCKDGSLIRLTYAGRNGHPYRSVGQHLIDTGAAKAETMSMDVLRTWLRAHPQESADLLDHNPSYIFFKRDPDHVSAPGPRAGAGVPLTPYASVAIDRQFWSYHLPFWIQTADSRNPATYTGSPGPMIAQDTGSAIRGAHRLDIYTGSGDTAGDHAGRIRDRDARIYVLWPRAECELRRCVDRKSRP